MDRWSDDAKRKSLRKLRQGWMSCQGCALALSRTNIVFGNGPVTADIMLIGEGPGEMEDQTGDVFVGESGHLLNALLDTAKILRENVFITNLVMCRPPSNRNPTKDERGACLGRLHEQIYTIDPMLIIPVGKVAMEALMGGKWKSILKARGEIGFVEIPGKVEEVIRYPAMPILHPAFIIREDKINRKTMNWEEGGWANQTWSDLVRARQRIEWLKGLYERPEEAAGKRRPKGRGRLRVVR